MPPRILHVEVGGSYGGSLRALELYLSKADNRRMSHDVLFYYPTPGCERLGEVAPRLMYLYDRLPSQSRRRQPGKARLGFRALLKRLIPDALISEILSWMSVIRNVPYGLGLFRLLRAGGYDLIHVNNSFTYQPLTLLAARMAGIPVVAHIRNPQRRGIFSLIMLSQTDCVVSDSHSHEKDLATWGSRVPVATCYNGVQLPTPDLSLARQLRQAFLNGSQLLIGSVGRLDDQKGYQDFIQAARYVVDSCPEVRFAVAGEGPLRHSLEKLIDDLKLNGIFSLCGFRNDVANFLSALDIFVCSSHWEGLPLAVVEAMLLKKPVVATDVGGNSEIVVTGRTGTLVPSGNPKALAQAIVSAIRDFPTATLCASEAHRTVAELFDPASNARKFDEILTTTLSRKRPPPKANSGHGSGD
jgi:glycosyltransferase involved in cell wall biosynthesis